MNIFSKLFKREPSQEEKLKYAIEMANDERLRIIFGDPRANPSLTEIGHQGINLDKMGGMLYNPDDIGIDTYKKMMKDAQVALGFYLIKYATISREWRISGTNKEQVDFLKANFENLDGRLSGALYNFLTALAFGFAVAEKVFVKVEEGKYSGKYWLKKIKGLDPETISFEVDPLGNLISVTQEVEFGKKIKLDLESLIIYVNDKEFGNFYGTSRLRKAYKNWFIKDTIIKFWNISLERYGMPLLVGTVPSATDFPRMLKALKSLQSNSYMAKTAGWTVEMIEKKQSSSQGGGYYASAIRYHDEQILKALVIPSLLVSEPRVGSQALSTTQFDVFELSLNNLEDDIIGLVNSYLIKPLIILNFGEQDEYPKLSFEPLSAEKKLTLSKYFALLTKTGIVGADEEWIRDSLAIPRRSEATITDNPPTPVAGATQQIKSPQPQRDGSV